MSEFMKGVTLLKQDLTEVAAEEALKGKVPSSEFRKHISNDLGSRVVLFRWLVSSMQTVHPKACSKTGHVVVETTLFVERFYHHLKKAGKPIEVVFFSRDRSKADLEENFTEKHGDWLCVKFGDDIMT